MFGHHPDDQSFLYKTKGGVQTPTKFHTLLFELLSTYDFARGGFTHMCYVEAGSTDHVLLGKPVAGPCCLEYAESLWKTVTAVENFFVGMGWVDGCESRWTHVTILLRRLFLPQLERLVARRDVPRARWARRP